MIRTASLFVVSLMAFAEMQAQSVKGPVAWKTIGLCGMTFSLPGTLKDKKARGIDSCIAVLEDDEMTLTLDYGLYSGVSRYDHYLDFEEKAIVIDRKKATFAAYRDSTEQRWVARIFVAVEPPRDGWGEVALNMFVVVKEKKEIVAAERIFKSIRFKKSR